MKRLILLLLTSLSISFAYAQSFPMLEGALEWRDIGPFRGGRSCAVTGVPGKPNLFYFGATGGGVWKTEDGGRSWESMSDGFFGGSVGSIAVAETDQNMIYVGGGEKTVRGNVSSGYGVWKSEDAGKNWISVGLEKTRHISRIRIHPNNPNIVWLASMGNLYKDNPERGIFKTEDGGRTWKKVLFVNAGVGAVDLEVDPNNPRILYASTWKVRRTPYDLSSGGEGSGLYKSTDGGETWKNISSNKGLPEGIWGISGVTVSPANSNRIWLIVENDNGGVFRSDDGGESWNKLNSERSLRQRAWYYTRIYADPKDEDVVYVMNVNYHKSKDGGKTFKSFRAPHGDHHDLWIAPEDPSRMIIGDDGGAQVTYDGGDTWSTYHNQSTAQFYRVTTDNHFPFRIYAAQQDNSTIRIAHRSDGSSIGTEDWESTAGGESAHIAVDPTDNDIVYGGSYGGYLTRLDHKTGFNRAINVWPDNPMGHGAEGMKYRFQWNFPIFFSKHDPKKLYSCSNHLHLSTNEGESWEVISPDLTRNDKEKLVSSGGPITKDNTGVEYYSTLFAAAESPIEEGIIWVGSDDGLIHLTQDGGKNWTDVTPGNIPKWLMINCIEPDPFDKQSCYVAGTLYKGGDFKPYLLKTENYGKSWKMITNGIPSEHFTRAIRVDPNQEGVLYTGTESGMYVSFDDGEQWQSLQLNLPVVPITDLVIKNDHLIAATQGRGIWIIDDLISLREHAKISRTAKEFHLFKPKNAYRISGRQNKKVKGSGKNHIGGLTSYFYLKNYDSKKDTVVLQFLNLQGDTIRSFSNVDKENKLEVEQGANIFSWDFRHAPAKKFEGMVLWWGSMNGAKVLPGTYTVKLMVNGKKQEQTFEILSDPRLKYGTKELAAQYAFINEVNNLVSRSHTTIQEIRELKKQMADYVHRYDSKPLKEKISEIDSTLTNVETNLYQTKNKSRQDPLNYPIKLTNKLAHLNSLVQISDAPPTLQMIEVQKELSDKINNELQTFERILKVDISELNELIVKEVKDFIRVKRNE